MRRRELGMSGSWRATVCRALVAGLLAGGALAGLPATTAEAGEGFEMESTTVFRVDGDAPSVTVVTTYEMTNTTPDRNLGGGRFEYYFFDGIRLPIDDPITDLTITVNGAAAQFEQSVVEGVPVVDVEFASNLRYGRTATIVVQYRLAGAAPRTDTFTRINPAYMSFFVFTYADAGLGDVRVEVPADWTTDWVGSDFDTERVDGGVRVLEATEIPDTDEFFVLFTARQDDRLDSTPVTVGDSLFEIRSWPGDAEWLAYAERHVVEGVPILERLVGTPWPEAAETDVIEASTPYLRGYAGFYNAADDVIEVGEELDSHTMLHELSHAWFNDESIVERWLSEGLADEIGARATEALGEPLPDPADYDDPDEPVEVDPFPLNSWGEPFALDDAEEYYGYRTSFVVLRALRDEIGEEAMTELVAGVLAADRAYRAEGSEESAGDTVDWREFLDLAEQVGGSDEIEALYREYVVTDAQVEQLDARADAVPQYEALAERGGEWAPPDAVRRAMALWRFDDVGDLIDDAGAVLDTRDELIDTLAPLDLEPAASIEDAYQDAQDIDLVAADADEHLGAAERMVAAQADLADRLESIELDVPTPTQGDYDAAPTALADEVEELADQAADVVAADAELRATLAEHALRVPALEAGSFVESPGATLEQLGAQHDAAAAVVASLDARDDSRSLVQRLGAIGGDVDAQLADATSLLADGDLAGATEAAGEASDGIATWQERGVARLVAAALGLLIGVLLVVAVRRIGRRRRAARLASAGDAAGDAAGDVAVPADHDPDARPATAPLPQWPAPVVAPPAEAPVPATGDPPPGA